MAGGQKQETESANEDQSIGETTKKKKIKQEMKLHKSLIRRI